jgi:protein TonB
MQMKFSLLAGLLGLMAIFTVPNYAQAEASDSQANSVESWKRQLTIRLTSRRIYPPNAPAEGGTAKVMFVLDRTGKLVSRALVESTGSSELDMAALATVESAAPFPEPPAELEDDMLRFTVPLIFKPRTSIFNPRTSWTGALPPADSVADRAKIDAKIHGVCRGC